MSEPTWLGGHRRVALSVLALAVAVTTCRDAPSGPSGQRGYVNISPVFTAGMNPAAFGITIDSLRAIVVRPPTDTLVDRTVAFPADSSALELGLSVLLQAPVETLTVHLQYLGAGLLLFTGSAQVEVTTGVPGDEPPVEIPVADYVGPGRDADSIVVTPGDSILSWGDSLRFRVAAFQAGVPLTQFYVSWTSTDTINAPVNGAGVLRAPGRRDTVFVIARTPPTTLRPGGVVDSVAVTFMPLPAAIAIVSGNGQSGSTGAPLAEALRVRVTATDGGGVAFARVRFRVALGGGSVADTLVIADDRGFAQTLATLGLTVGAQVFEASLDASRFVTFNASAIAGQAVRLEFTQQPGATTAGIALSPAVQVTARDSAGSIAAGFTGPVTVALLANPGGATLGGIATVNAVAGVASFTDLTLDRTGTGYTLLATAPSLVADTSAAFSVVAAAATQLVFTTQPASAIAGTAIPVVVTARDPFGNTATGFGGNVTIAIGANPGTGTLAGTATVAAVSGIATFATLSIDKVGAGYTLSATGGGLPAATSAAFTISPAAASQLAFTAQPTTAVAGVAIAPAVAVTVRDAFGNTVTGFAGSVTVAIGTNPGTGTLSGTATAATVAGVATFGTLSIDRVGTGYTLTATSGTLTGATSAGFNITPAAASQLVFTTPPVTSVAGVAIPVAVTARDAFGNTATGFTGTVAVAIGTNPTGATLGGTTSQAAVAGVATFGNIAIDTVGTGYTLVATSGALAQATSAAFDITPAAAAELVFTGQPATAVAGVAIPVAITARDAFGNTATGFTGTVTVAIGTNPTGATLLGTTSQAAVAGVATFANLAIDTVGTGYTLVATAGALTQATSAAFDITPAAASQLVFTTPPVTSVAGATIPVAVMVRDAFGNTATGFTGTVAVAIGTNPTGATLLGTTSQAAVAGVAAFADLTIDTVGTGYTLVATSGALTQATSALFNITPAAASQLVFTTPPVTSVAGATIPVTVTARDAFGNTATGFAGTVAVAIGTNPTGATLAGTTSQAAVAGVAAFANLSIDTVGTGYTLVATSGALTQATSAPFAITPAAASQLVFTVQPTTAVAGVAIAPAVVVTARDALGNTATGFTGGVAIAIGTNPTGATLLGTTSQAAVAGVATFANLSIDTVGTGYTLTASSGALTPATSGAFDITPAAASQLVFTVQPTPAVAGVAIAPAVVVTARDALGNTATGFTGAVTIAIGANPGNGTLSGTATQPAVAGVATFTDLSIDKAATGYTLAASATGPAGTTSGAFNITAAPAALLIMVGGSGQAAVAGAVLPGPLDVRVTDQFGNGVGAVQITWTVVSGGGTVDPLPSFTDLTGIASVLWTLGSTVGSQVVQASAGSLTGSPVAFTATAFPAGTTSLWVGGDGSSPTDWHTAANWQPAQVPTFSDNVFVPAAAVHQPVVDSNATAGDVIVENGASVTVSVGATLNVIGNVVAGATITGAGTLEMSGEGATLQGTVPTLRISGFVQVSGPTSVAGDLVVVGSLDLNGQPVTVLGDFATTVTGTLIMTQAADLLVVQGAVGFNGGGTLGSLSAGTIAVAGNFVATDSNSATPFAATGGHQVVLNGAALQLIDGVRAIRSSQSHFQDLVVAGSDTARPVTALQANGTVTVGGGTFDAGGQSVFVGGDFATTGAGILRMASASDLVAVQGNALFAGGSESAQLFNGVLRVGGDFAEAGAPPSGGSFEGAVSHVVEMNGTAPQTISFGNPVISHFGSLVIANPAGVSAATDASVVENLTIQTGATLTLGSSVLTARNTVIDGTLDVSTGTLDVITSLTHAAGGVLQGAGTVDVTGATAAFNGSIRPGTSPGLLTIDGGAPLGGTASIEVELAGNVAPGGDFDQLRVTDSVALGGSLNVTTLAGFTPLAGDSFPVLTFARRVADLAAVTGLNLGNGIVLDTVWSPTELALVARQVITLDVSPVDLAANPAKDRVYALATPSGQKTGGPPMVMTIDATTNQPVDTVILETANAYAMTVDTVSEKVYVSDFLGGLVVVDAGSGVVNTVLTLSQPGFPAVDDSKRLVYVPAGVFTRFDPNCIAAQCPLYAPALFKVDGAADTVFTADTVFLAGERENAYGTAFSPSDGLVYVGVYFAGVLQVVNPDQRSILATVEVPLPYAVAINPTTRKLYVSSDADSTVRVYDLTTPAQPTLLKSIPIGGYIPNITVDVASNRAYVPSWDAGTVTIIDGSTDEVVGVLPAGTPADGVYDVVVSPANPAAIYAARYSAGQIAILRQ